MVECRNGKKHCNCGSEEMKYEDIEGEAIREAVVVAVVVIAAAV